MSNEDSHRTANELFQTGKVPYEAAASAASDPFRVEVLRQLTDMATTMKEIQTCLVGNRLGTTGLVQRMADAEKANENNKKAIEEERNRVNIKLAKAGTLMSILGIIFTGLCAWWEGRK